MLHVVMSGDGRWVANDSPEAQFAEKGFYLDEFHERTLLFVLAPGEPADDDGLVTLLRELSREDAHGIVLTTDVRAASALARRFRARRGESGPRRPLAIPDLASLSSRKTLYGVWDRLREGPVAIIVLPEVNWPELADGAARLAARLRVHKLVLIDPEGGISQTGQRSFLTEGALEDLLGGGKTSDRSRRGRKEGQGDLPEARKALLGSVKTALEIDVPSVNLCSLRGLARELYTYEGSGTLFTPEDYCRIEPLGIDDFGEVERLLERGQAEGFLKIRGREEIGEILLCGYGARLGASHLAGVAALLDEPYAREGTAEIVALYTISRFKGEGVGGKLIARILGEAKNRGLDSVFACTTVRGAGQFFEHEGFARISPEEVPAGKWRTYEPGRIEQVAVYRKRLENRRQP